MQNMDRFRTAFGGFNRQDVANYIERKAREHQASLQKYKDEVARLTAEKDALKAESADLKARLEAALEGKELPTVLEGDPETLELAAYRRAEAAERNANLRIRRQTEKLDGLVAGLRGSYSAAGEELAGLANTVRESTEKLQSVFDSLEENFRETSHQMQKLQEDTEE